MRLPCCHRCHSCSAVSHTFNGCVGVCQLSRLPCDTLGDWSDWGPDGHGWLDQVEHYQTTHPGRHRLRGISVLGGRGSTETMETLQSNKLIGGRETDTPVLYRVTERRQTKRGEGGEVARMHRLKGGDSKWGGWRTLLGVCTAKTWVPLTPQQHEQHDEWHVTGHIFKFKCCCMKKIQK